MSKSTNMRNRKPDLMVLLAFFVGVGVLLTSFVQAAEPVQPVIILQHADEQKSWHEQWLKSMWGLDLAGKLKSWKPKITAAESGDGVQLSRPFGTRGPAVQLSTSIPERASSSLRAGGDSQVGLANDIPDAYIFLQKRW